MNKLLWISLKHISLLNPNIVGLLQKGSCQLLFQLRLKSICKAKNSQWSLRSTEWFILSEWSSLDQQCLENLISCSWFSNTERPFARQSFTGSCFAYRPNLPTKKCLFSKRCKKSLSTWSSFLVCQKRRIFWITHCPN